MVEPRPVRCLRGPFPIVQDLADPAMDHRRVRVQRLDVPEERRRIPEGTCGRGGEARERGPRGPLEAREIKRAPRHTPSEGEQAEMREAEQERHEFVVMVQGDVDEGRSARSEQFLRLDDGDPVPAIAERDVPAGEGPEARAEDRVDTRDPKTCVAHRPQFPLDGRLQTGHVEDEGLRLDRGDPVQDVRAHGHRDGDGHDVGRQDSLREVGLERVVFERPGDVIHDDVVSAGPEVAAKPAAHLTRAPDHEDLLLRGLRQADEVLDVHALVDQEPGQALGEGEADPPRRTFGQEPREYAILRVLGDDGAALELLLDPELLREVQPLGHVGHDLPIDIRNLFAQPRDLCIAHENPPRNMRSRTPKQVAWAFTRAPPWRHAASVRLEAPARSTARTIARPDARASRGQTSWASRAAGLPRGAEWLAGCRPSRTRVRPWGESMPGPGDRAPRLESRGASRSPGGPRVRRVRARPGESPRRTRRTNPPGLRPGASSDS